MADSDAPDFDAIESLLDAHVTDNCDAIGDTATCSGIQAAVRTAGGERWRYSTGWTSLEQRPEPVTDSTPVDLASLTKPMATAMLLYQAIDEEKAFWSTPVAKLLEWWPGGRARTANLRDLCVHISGLPDWRPLYDGLTFDPTDAVEREDNLRCVQRRIAQLDPEQAPGEAETYSDLGYIALARALERVFDGDFDELVRRRILEPLELSETRFVASHRGDAPLAEAMATENIEERGGVVRGRVHDRNASVLGGVAGHAGLFSTANDVLRFGEHLLGIDDGTAPSLAEDHPLSTTSLVSQRTLQKAWSAPNRAENRRHRGGWDTPTGERSSAGRGFAARETVGHLGFTGTSLWLDRTGGTVAVLLTNRVYPSRENDRIDSLRVEFHEMVIPPPDR